MEFSPVHKIVCTYQVHKIVCTDRTTVRTEKSLSASASRTLHPARVRVRRHTRVCHRTRVRRATLVLSKCIDGVLASLAIG